jgi:hypothetical protein
MKMKYIVINMYNEELKHIEVWKRHSLRMNSVK